jgi:hypothetical protein
MWSRATGKQKKELSYVERRLSEATADARNLQCPRHEKLGILFVAPFYPAGKQSEMSSHLASWLEGIYSIPYSAMAWYLLDRRKLKPHRTDNVHPGIVLIARLLTPSQKLGRS